MGRIARRSLWTVVALLAAGLLLRGAVARLFPLPYREMINEYAYQERLDPHLVAAVVKVESSFDPHALSPKGARGLMQLMPDTAKWCASRMGLETVEVEDLHDPRVNIQIGTWYLAHLHDEFDGNEVVALAAYNSGRGKVRSWLEGTWDGTLEDIGSIPYAETRHFIRRVRFARAAYGLLYGGRVDVSLAEIGEYLRISVD